MASAAKTTAGWTNAKKEIEAMKSTSSQILKESEKQKLGAEAMPKKKKKSY